MASIGGSSFNVLNLSGGEGQPGLQSQDVSRPGVNGKAFLVLGRKAAGPTRYSSEVDVANAGALKTQEATYKALQGTIQSLSDDHGNSYTVFINAVTVTEQKAVALYSGGSNGSHIIRAEWEVTIL